MIYLSIATIILLLVIIRLTGIAATNISYVREIWQVTRATRRSAISERYLLNLQLNKLGQIIHRLRVRNKRLQIMVEQYQDALFLATGDEDSAIDAPPQEEQNEVRGLSGLSNQ